MKAYKITDKQGKCRGFQYEVGKTYQEDKAVLCSSGFHACLNPMDCMSYHDIYEARFFEVDARGEIDKGDDKIASTEIEIIRELSLKEFTSVCFDYLFNKEKSDVASGNDSKLAASGNYSKLAASGNYSKLAASGNDSKLAASGNYSKLASSGNDSKLAASGYSSKLAASGNYSKLASSGNDSKLAASGYSSKLAASGNDSQLAASGDSSIAAGIGFQNKVSVSDNNSWIVIADWQDGQPKRVVAKKPGQKINGVVIETNTYYWFDGGKLCSQKKE